jgi:hypothetical protein
MKSALITCIFIGASFLQMRADPVAGSQTDLRDGFYLLHHDCKEESQASMITWIKTTPPQVVDYIKRVSQLAKESVQILDQMADKDPGLRGEADPDATLLSGGANKSERRQGTSSSFWFQGNAFRQKVSFHSGTGMQLYHSSNQGLVGAGSRQLSSG